MRTFISVTLLCGLLLGASGCGTAAKRVFTEVKGASSKATPVPGIVSSELVQYRGVTVGTPRTDLDVLVDRKFMSALPGAVRDALTTGEEILFPGGSPTLNIDPEVTWYYEATGVGDILGSDSYAVVLFWIETDGKPLGKVQLVTKSGASRIDEADMAASMAKGLAKFFKKGRAKRE